MAGKTRRLIRLAVCALPLLTSSQASIAAEAGAPKASEWPLVGLNAENHHFSPLRQINDKTVKDLGVAWYVDLPMRAGPHGVPLVADGLEEFWSMHAMQITSKEKMRRYLRN